MGLSAKFFGYYLLKSSYCSSPVSFCRSVFQYLVVFLVACVYANCCACYLLLYLRVSSILAFVRLQSIHFVNNLVQLKCHKVRHHVSRVIFWKIDRQTQFLVCFLYFFTPKFVVDKLGICFLLYRVNVSTLWSFVVIHFGLKQRQEVYESTQPAYLFAATGNPVPALQIHYFKFSDG